MSAFFILEEYCSSFPSNNADAWSHLDESSRNYLQQLNLSSIHPFCNHDATPFPSDVPPMGPLLINAHHDTLLDAVVTLWHQVSPALLAMGELWLRLFASVLAPLCIAYLMSLLIMNVSVPSSKKKETSGTKWIAVSCVLSVASSLVLATDMLYVLEYGARYGVTLLAASSILSILFYKQYKLPIGVMGVVVFLWALFVQLVYDPSSPNNIQFGGPEVPRIVTEGLYFNPNNALMNNIASEWKMESRTYSQELGATPWMPTGDSRTGLPFLLHSVDTPSWTRVWLPTTDDEVVALDFSFPTTGYNDSQPLYLLLHGLNGGSREDYVMDFANRRTAEGATVVVMVARGLMDLPIKGWNVFHGARVDDVSNAAIALRKTLSEQQILAGVGYSMGAIVLANYVARSGQDCALDSAIAISGGLDMRHQNYYFRAQRLWQPMLAKELRDVFVVGKFGERYRHRLTKDEMLQMMRSTHITGIDEHAVVAYNSEYFDTLMHYYAEMSAMGDAPLEDDESVSVRLANVSIPLCVLHALDDPLVTWKAVAADEGPMFPSTLVKSGSGYLMLLLTKRGGHVGWPLGAFAWQSKWKWMSDAAKEFTEAVVRAKKMM